MTWSKGWIWPLPMGICAYDLPLMWCENRRYTSVIFFPQTHSPSLIWDKSLDKPIFGRILQDIPAVLLRILKAEKNKERVKTHHRQRWFGRHANLMQCGLLDWIPEKKKRTLILSFFAFSMVALTAYGGSHTRDLIGAVATDLFQSHRNVGSKLGLQHTPQLTATLDP